MSVFDIFEQLESTGSTSEKTKILAANKDNKEFVELLDYAFNFKRKFFIKKFEIKPNTQTACVGSTAELLDILDELQCRKTTGHAAIKLVEDFLSTCTPQEQKWYARVILKDLRCNFGITLCKKAGIDIPEFEVMLAKDGKECKKLKEIVGAGVYVTPKFNGYRCLAVSTDGAVTLYSRNGVEYLNFPTIVAELEKIGGNFVLDGEIMSDDFNAMQQTALSSKSTKSVGDVYYAVFGWVPVDEWEKQEFKVPTKQRLDSLQTWFDVSAPNTTLIRHIQHELLYTVDECMDFEKRHLALGYEGAMLLPNIPYYLGKKSNKLLKLKTFQSMDCPVLKIYRGEAGKEFENTMGGMTVLQENGVECDCGSGFSKEDRDHMWSHQDEFIGRTAEIQYQEIQKVHNRMQFPTFQRWRNDK